MGNTVTAAERMAEHIVHPSGDPVPAAGHNNNNKSFDYSSGVPPPECPMHQADAPKMVVMAASECPQGFGKDEINPLNMVSVFFFRLVFVPLNNN